MKDIKLFIGSVDGAVESAGENLAEELKSHGYQVNINSTPKMNDVLDLKDSLLLIITSTTGEGELPRDLRPLWRKLYTKRPSLSGVRFAVAVFGDSSYGDDFCLGGKELDRLFAELGAQRVQEAFLSDAEETVFPEDDIATWGVDIANEVSNS